VKLRALSFLNHVPSRRDPTPMIDQAVEWGLDVIVSQGTGKDFGPHMLGSGTQFPVRNFKENIRPYIKAAHRLHIPFVLSVGIAGAHQQLAECLEAFDELCREEALDLEVAVISGDVDPALIRKKLEAGVAIPRMDDHDALPELLRVEDVDVSANIVAQMGPEPIMAALELGVDGVITGRALDVGLFMAPALRAGASKATAALFGKLMECCGVALYPGDPGVAIYGEIEDDDAIVIRSPDPANECRVRNLAAHSFYERKNPFREENPGGYLDLDDVTYEQLDTQSVRVRGPKWGETPYTVKLEGAASMGFRAINVAGIREPRYVDCAPEVIERIKEELRTADRFAHLREGVDYHLNVTLYGRDAVLGDIEPRRGDEHELGAVIDAVGPTAEMARELCYYAYLSLWIRPYPGRKTTAGNNAQRFTQPILDGGELFRWSIWHLMPLDDPLEPFDREVEHFPREVAVA
jgi:hypothetical protein